MIIWAAFILVHEVPGNYSRKVAVGALKFSLYIYPFAPNPDTRNFSGKVSWNFKSFAKIKWCVRGEVLLPTFLRKKSRLGRLPQTRTQRTFREKSFGISKASLK